MRTVYPPVHTAPCAICQRPVVLTPRKRWRLRHHDAAYFVCPDVAPGVKSDCFRQDQRQKRRGRTPTARPARPAPRHPVAQPITRGERGYTVQDIVRKIMYPLWLEIGWTPTYPDPGGFDGDT